MRINREKAAFALSLIVFVAGMYGVVVGFVSPSQTVRIPNVELPRGETKFFAPDYRKFTSAEGGSRNPFSFSEGWQPLDTLPMPSPTIPTRVRVLPLLSASVAAEDGGLLFESTIPKEKEEEDGSLDDDSDSDEDSGS